MNNIIAAMGSAQFRNIDYVNRRRIDNANYLNRNLRIEGIRIPYVPNNCKHVFLRYVVKIDEKLYGLSRNELITRLRSKGIDAEAPYSYTKEYNRIYGKIDENSCFPNAEDVSDSIISLPIHPCLKENQLAKTVQALNDPLEC